MGCPVGSTALHQPREEVPLEEAQLVGPNGLREKQEEGRNEVTSPPRQFPRKAWRKALLPVNGSLIPCILHKTVLIGSWTTHLD